MDDKPQIKTIDELKNMLWFDLQKYLSSLDKTELLALLDRRIRNNRRVTTPNDFLEHWLLILRASGVRVEQQDDSWGELEKLLAIILKNHIKNKRDDISFPTFNNSELVISDAN